MKNRQTSNKQLRLRDESLTNDLSREKSLVFYLMGQCSILHTILKLCTRNWGKRRVFEPLIIRKLINHMIRTSSSTFILAIELSRNDA